MLLRFDGADELIESRVTPAIMEGCKWGNNDQKSLSMIGNRQRGMPNLGGIYTESGSLAGEIILATHDPADSDGEKVIQITFFPCSVQIRSVHGNTS